MEGIGGHQQAIAAAAFPFIFVCLPDVRLRRCGRALRFLRESRKISWRVTLSQS
jgi:hypothetical protein